MARTLVLALAIVLVAGCSKRAKFKVPESELRRIHSVGTAYNQIADAADSGDASAFIRLYDVAKDDELLGVEYSEVAIIKLTELLYYKTAIWIDAFSKLPSERLDSLEKFQPWAYIGEVDFQSDSTVTQDRFRQVILARLDSIKSFSPKMQLVSFLQKEFRAASDSSRAELERKQR
jgi:hypothetical protein